MKRVRVSIEHGYAEKANSFKICTNLDQWKISQERSHAKEQLIVCYLLSNILICFNGSQVSARDTFFCSTPTVEEYLELGDEDEPW